MDPSALAGTLGRVIINPAILLLFGVALVVFIWGLVRFLWAINSGGGKGGDVGKKHMLWGIIGMFIMVAAFGILHVIQNTLGSVQGSQSCSTPGCGPGLYNPGPYSNTPS